MIISEKKNFEREFFKSMRDKSPSIDMQNVVINVKIYLDSIIRKGLRKKYIGIYWPLKNEVDLKSLGDKYLLALPRCEKNKELLFCEWDDKKLTKDFEGIPSPDSSKKLNYMKISMIFVPCLAIDKNLTRLGYGGGYFDKLRKDNDWKNVPCIGVLTSNCVSTIPLTRAEWDIPLSGFITEKEIFV